MQKDIETLIINTIKNSFDILLSKIIKTNPDWKFEIFEDLNEKAFSLSFFVPVNDEEYVIEIIELTNYIVKARFGTYDEDARTTALMKKVIDVIELEFIDTKKTFLILEKIKRFIINKSKFILDEINLKVKLSLIKIPNHTRELILDSLLSLKNNIFKQSNEKSTYILDIYEHIHCLYFQLAIENNQFGDVIIHFTIDKYLSFFRVEILIDFLTNSFLIKVKITNKSLNKIKYKKINTLFNRCYRLITRELNHKMEALN